MKVTMKFSIVKYLWQKKNKLKNILKANPALIQEISSSTYIGVFVYYLQSKGMGDVFREQGFKSEQVLKEFFNYFNDGLETLFPHISIE